MTFGYEHPKWDQKPWFILLSETSIWESPHLRTFSLLLDWNEKVLFSLARLQRRDLFSTTERELNKKVKSITNFRLTAILNVGLPDTIGLRCGLEMTVCVTLFAPRQDVVGNTLPSQQRFPVYLQNVFNTTWKVMVGTWNMNIKSSKKRKALRSSKIL